MGTVKESIKRKIKSITNFKERFEKGFTLLEVTVTILLIGLFAAITTGTYNEVRQEARDEERVNSLRQLQLAVESYKETYEEYPSECTGMVSLAIPHQPITWYCPDVEYMAGVAPTFIEELPLDPNEDNLAPEQGFEYYSNGDDYKILVNESVESKFVESYSDEFSRCPRSCTGVDSTPYGNHCSGSAPPANTYAVYSSGAICW